MLMRNERFEIWTYLSYIMLVNTFTDDDGDLITVSEKFMREIHDKEICISHTNKTKLEEYGYVLKNE